MGALSSEGWSSLGDWVTTGNAGQAWAWPWCKLEDSVIEIKMLAVSAAAGWRHFCSALDRKARLLCRPRLPLCIAAAGEATKNCPCSQLHRLGLHSLTHQLLMLGTNPPKGQAGLPLLVLAPSDASAFCLQEVEMLLMLTINSTCGSGQKATAVPHGASQLVVSTQWS